MANQEDEVYLAAASNTAELPAALGQTKGHEKHQAHGVNMVQLFRLSLVGHVR